MKLSDEVDLKVEKCKYNNLRIRFLGKFIALFHLVVGHKRWNLLKSPRNIFYYLTNNEDNVRDYIYSNFMLLRFDGSAFTFKQIFTQLQYNLELFKSKPIIVDLGSNVGLSIIYFKNKFPNSRIYAFEPNKILIPVLKENVWHSQADSKDIHVFAKGVLRNKSNNAVLKTPNNDHSQSFVSLKKYKYSKGVTDENIIETIAFQEIINLVGGEIDLLKIDIESGEFEILPDIYKFHKAIRNFIVEVHDVSAVRLLEIVKYMEKYYNLIITPAYTENIVQTGMVNEFLNKRKQTYLLFAKHV